MFQANEHSGPVVYASSRRPRPIPARHTRSIRLIAYGSAAIIFTLFLAITATNLMLAKGHYQDDSGDIPQSLLDYAHTIEAQLSVFNQIVQHVASQPTTRDILISNDETASQIWAQQMRHILPQATGVGLLTPKGKVLGHPSAPNLAPQCLTDMTKISQNEHIMTPAVHEESSGTVHFDLTAPVVDDTEKSLGMLFVSISLEGLKSLLQENTTKGTRLSLHDGYGNVILQQDSIQDVSNSRQSQVILTGTDWKLRLLEPANGPLLSFLSLAIFNISAILLTVGVIAFLVRFIMRSMDKDFDQVKTILGDLASGEPIGDTLPTPRLRETAEVFPALSQIHRIIDKKQQLLEHQELSDKLTGLSNRRQFNIEFARAYDFARRGTPVCVVLMRMSGLEKLTKNQINQAVKILASTLKEHSRRVDHAARLDTDSFALLMFGASPEGTTPCLERICRSFRKHQSDHPAIPNDNICSLSLGYTRIHAHRDSNAAEVLHRAETALAEAEQSTDRHIISA